MVLSMPVLAASRVDQLNMLTLRFQDEAYTLAYYMLGNDELASEVTQKAFAGMYENFSLRMDAFKQAAMRNVLAGCRSAEMKADPAATRDALNHRLLRLNTDARSAVVLVDILGLCYDEAGHILGCTQKQVGQLLAQARASLSRMTVPEPAVRHPEKVLR